MSGNFLYIVAYTFHISLSIMPIFYPGFNETVVFRSGLETLQADFREKLCGVM